MNLPLFIARRYLFSKKSHHAINIISLISVLGIMTATTALVCTLSVFNGFQEVVASCFTNFDPQLKLVPAQGKTFSCSDTLIHCIQSDPDVELTCGVLEEHALVRYQGKQAMITLMGVEDNFALSTDIYSILYGSGTFLLHADAINYGIPGIRLAMLLDMGTQSTEPIQIYAPRPGEKIDMLNPSTNFNQDELYSPGVVFNVNQKTYDQDYILAPLPFAQKLFEKPNRLSSLQIKLKPGADVNTVKKRLSPIIKNHYLLKDRYQQQKDIFRIMEVEKYMSYLFLTLILFITCFNIVGSLSMLIIDKRGDIQTLSNLGASPRLITSIYTYEGRLISLLGIIIGLILGIAICWLQQAFGFLRLGDQAGAFIIDAYPVSMHLADILIIFITVILISFTTSWLPAHYLTKRIINT